VCVVQYKPDVHCIQHQQFRRDRGYITRTLATGRWSVRIRSTSLAGNGSWTPHVYFDVADPFGRFESCVFAGLADLVVVELQSVRLWTPGARFSKNLMTNLWKTYEEVWLTKNLELANVIDVVSESRQQLSVAALSVISVACVVVVGIVVVFLAVFITRKRYGIILSCTQMKNVK